VADAKAVNTPQERESISAALVSFGTATVVDACAQASMLDAAWIALVPERAVAGPAVTIRCIPGDNLSIHAAMDQLSPGDIMVIAGAESSSIALLGDMLGTQAKARGVAGVLLDGPVRDVKALCALDLPVWARSIRPRGPVKKVFGSVGEDVTITGVCIRSGDWIVLDADGAVVVPAEAVGGAIDSARLRHDNEGVKRERYAAGELSLDVLRLRPVIEAQRAQSGRGR